MTKRTQARNARGQRDRIRKLQLFLGRTLNELADEYDADSILLSDTHPDHVWALAMGRYTGMISASVYDDARGLSGDLVRAALAYLAWAVAVETRGQTPWRNFSLDYPLVATASDRSLLSDPPELPVVRRRRSIDGQSRRKQTRLLESGA